MAWFVVPHNVSRTTVRIWVGWWLTGVRPPTTLVFRLPDNTEVIRTDITDVRRWRSVGRALGSIPRCTFRTVDQGGLTANTRYRVQLIHRNNRNVLSECYFDTLPTRLPRNTLPSSGLDDRPFTIFLGSCFWDFPDNGDVARAYRAIFDDPAESPHIKLLCGDQVYVDEPPGDFDTLLGEVFSPVTGAGGSAPILESVNRRYHASWHKLKDLLERGANFLATDDHDFWNDFPFVPLPIWPELQNSTVRNLVRGVTRQFARNVQQAANTRRIQIGRFLDIMVADTRIARTESTFLPENDLVAIENWIAGLRSPGVLVLGQPLLTSATGRMFGLLTDHNLGFFKSQYRRLVTAISSSTHDLVILSGDIHFGRVARFKVHRRAGSDPVKVFEIVSSPLSALDVNFIDFLTEAFPGQNINEILPNLRSGSREEQDLGDRNMHPFSFPPDLRNTDPASFSSLVDYEHHIPVNSGQLQQNLAMTLRFWEGSVAGSVAVQVIAWLLETTQPGSTLPQIAWSYGFDLDTGRLPTDGSVPNRTVLAVTRSTGGKILSLRNPYEDWSPRLVHEAISDIQKGLANYFASPHRSVPARPIHVVNDNTRGITYLRTSHDDREPNNLADLPNIPRSDWNGR